MRTAGVIAIATLAGVAAVSAWWWTEAREDDAMRLATASVAERFAEARTEAEGAPATPTLETVEAQRTKTPAAPVEPAPTTATPQFRSVRVHVVDRDTRAELTDVTVTRNISSMRAVEGAASPVTIEPELHLSPLEPRENFWVTAPGYVRESLSIDFRDSTERTVDLVRCATLLVTIRGELPKTTPPPPPRKSLRAVDFGTSGPPRGARNAELRLKHEQNISGMYRSLPLALGETRVDELVPGNLTVSVEIGAAPPIVLASKVVRVAAGETARVELDVPPFAMPAAAPLAGTLRVPLGVPDGKLGLSISPRGIAGATGEDGIELESTDLTPIPGRSGAYRWEAGDVLIGRYAISIRGTSITVFVDVPPSGATDVELESLAHAQLCVRVVSSTDGSPVKLSWLDWTPKRADGSTASSPILLLHDETTHTFRSIVPLGSGELESFGADLWTLDEAVRAEIFPGDQELVASVRPIGGADVVLAADGKPVEFAPRLVDAVTVAPIGGTGRCLWKRFRNTSLSFAADPPGRYRVTLPDVDGYEPVPPFEVDVAIGKLTPMRVELRRSR